jgi:HK97 family phage major capsid protein
LKELVSPCPRGLYHSLSPLKSRTSTPAPFTNEAARVAEGASKPSLGPTVTENFIKPLKIAATVEASLEILQDHEQFAQWLPVELQRSVINSESLYLIQANAAGGPTASEFNGLLAVSGTLSQDATGLTFADALSHAYTKIRTGSAFSEPDLVLTSPTTAAAALRTKTTTGAYVFDIVRGPGGLNQQNEFDVFGVRTVTSTQVPDGTAIVMSVQGGAAVGWIRMGLELMYNPTAAPLTRALISGVPTSTAGGQKNVSP